ncbi:PREDICTED: uncharacterized protein LOC106818313 [Priapulus caudatus]|uniref:Uncharacterized protein LOC106818313 n=1 Tax=Priapulus caudatus TaxID=37621 RepID=A0ABM1F246_PRICU|nr:PREDICTED: uncharacterized protein LOC106818313 [Priapulus caudatus]
MYQRGNAPTSSNWVFGIVERHTRKCVLYIMKDRKRTTLLPLIQRPVQDGSTIYSDEFARYKSLRRLGYDHQTVCHKTEFLSPDGVCTNTIEGLWSEAKLRIKHMHGVRTSMFPGVLDEFMYRCDTPQFAQIYVHDPDHDQEEAHIRLGHMHLPASTTIIQRNMLLTLLQSLQLQLRQCNPYVQDFIQACDIPAAELGQVNFVISESARPLGEHVRRYNRSFKEVSVLMADAPGKNDFVLHMRERALQTLQYTHRATDPLYYILLFPRGTDGWHLGLCHVNPRTGEPVNKRMVSREFYTYRLQLRQNQSDALFRAKRLFQEYCCMAFATAENQRLFYLKNNQKKLRAELYNNICDMVHAHDAAGKPGDPAFGKPVILPPSFAGGPREMHRRFQDAMAIVRKYHRPDLFITMTCNPGWKEIKHALLPNQTPTDRLDIVARVFKEKLRAFLDEIIKDGIIGKVTAHLYVVEFQKRGLPHAHILIILRQDCRLHKAEDVDKVVCAELPPDPLSFEEGSLQRQQTQRLQNIILQCMLHGPCGSQYANAPCMKNGMCDKGYRKAFNKETDWNTHETYPTYRRRSPQQGGRQIFYKNRKVDNSWVVPYNPYTSTRYNAHINCEACCSALAAKYLFKYVHKGPDRAMMHVQGSEEHTRTSVHVRDEVTDY